VVHRKTRHDEGIGDRAGALGAGRARPQVPRAVPSAGVGGSDVRTSHVQMAKLGLAIDVDGEYGPQSEKVCFDFQRAHRLEVDGIVGPETWEATFTPK